MGAQFCTAGREERAGIPGVVGAVAGKEADEEQRQVAVGRRRPPSCPAGEENGGPFGIALRPASGAVLLLHRPNERKQLCSASGAAENPLRGEERENRSQKKKRASTSSARCRGSSAGRWANLPPPRRTGAGLPVPLLSRKPVEGGQSGSVERGAAGLLGVLSDG